MYANVSQLLYSDARTFLAVAKKLQSFEYGQLRELVNFMVKYNLVSYVMVHSVADDQIFFHFGHSSFMIFATYC